MNVTTPYGYGSPYIKVEEQNSLTAQMKDATRQMHGQVEKSPFMNSLQSGRASLEAYRQYVVDLYQIYNALEKRICQLSSDPALDGLMIPEMFRRDKLANDCKALGGDLEKPTLSAFAYAQHLEKIEPCRLVAHAYTRYLGDLFGGQTLRKYVEDVFGDQAATFYDFSEVVNLYNKRSPQQFAFEYKTILNQIRLDYTQQNAVVEEASIAFDHASKCLAELENL